MNDDRVHAPVTVADWYEAGPYASFLTEARLPSSSPVRMFHVRQPPGSYPDRPLSAFSLALALDATGPDLVDLGETRGLNIDHTGIVTVAPPDSDVLYETSTGIAFLAMSLPVELMDHILEERGSARVDLGGLHAYGGHRDARLTALMSGLWSEAAEGLMGALLADEVALAIAETLVRLAGLRTPSRVTAPLDGARLGRVRELIEDQLGEDLPLASLAAAAGLSPYHFARAFRAATGVSPQRWLMRRRLARAHAAITSTADPLAAVAVACGFSSQAHLTTAMRRSLQITPASLRRSSGARR